jgi:SHS2 domain-containing protein
MAKGVKRFEWVEHPSDIGFRAYGRNLAEALENAALALFEVMVDTSQVRPLKEVSIELETEDVGALLYDWLDRFLYFHDAQGLVLSKFKVDELNQRGQGFRLKARAWGELFDPKRHDARTAVKAMTYHMMDINLEKDKCMVQVVVDI